MKIFSCLSQFWYARVMLLLCLLFMSSCIEDVDFDQPTDVILTPVIEASLVYLEVEGSRFIDNGSEVSTVTDAVSNIEILEDEFVDDNLEKVELFFDVANQIPRRFDVQIDFRDINDQLQRSTIFSVMPSADGEIVITEHIEVFDEASIEQLKNTYTIVLTLNLQPSSDGSTLNESTTETIALDSKGKFYFRIES